MNPIPDKGGSSFQGIKLLLCENPLPPLAEAIAAAQAQLPACNFYTRAYSAPLRALLSKKIGVPEHHFHINAGSELILRQLFDRFGQRVHLLTPTYALFPEIAGSFTETRLLAETDFAFDLSQLVLPGGTSLAVIVNPNNPNGGTFGMTPLPELLRRHPQTRFLVDEAFIGLSGQSVASLVPDHPNLLVTRTFSKAHSLAGLRIGYAILPEAIAEDLNRHNDAYPLARPSEAAAMATLFHEDKINARTLQLRTWTAELAARLRTLGVRTFPTETYFFLADFSPLDAGLVAQHLRERNILVKPLNDPVLGPGFIRVTTALPENNERFVNVLEELLKSPFQALHCRHATLVAIMSSEAVMVVIRDDVGRFLLVRRKRNDLIAPGCWTPVAGTIEPEETERQAVIRECAEETGLTVEPVEKLGDMHATDHGYLIHWWTARILGEHLRLRSDELDDFRWVSREEISELYPMFDEHAAFLKNLQPSHCQAGPRLPPAPQ